jgi:hypothetical protein
MDCQAARNTVCASGKPLRCDKVSASLGAASLFLFLGFFSCDRWVPSSRPDTGWAVNANADCLAPAIKARENNDASIPCNRQCHHVTHTKDAHHVERCKVGRGAPAVRPGGTFSNDHDPTPSATPNTAYGDRDEEATCTNAASSPPVACLAGCGWANMPTSGNNGSAVDGARRMVPTAKVVRGSAGAEVALDAALS